MAEYRIGDTRDLGSCSACGNVIVIEPDNDVIHPQGCGNPVKLADGSWLCGSLGNCGSNIPRNTGWIRRGKRCSPMNGQQT